MLPGTLPIIYAGIVIICYQVPICRNCYNMLSGTYHICRNCYNMLPGTLPIIYAGIVIICYQVPYLSYMQELL